MESDDGMDSRTLDPEDQELVKPYTRSVEDVLQEYNKEEWIKWNKY